MRGIQAEGNKRTIARLKRLMKEANEDGEYRVAWRIHGVILNLEGYSNPEVSEVLKVHRSKPVIWMRSWNDYDIEGLFEGHRSGRPSLLIQEQKEILGDIIDSGPVAYGFTSGVWTSQMISCIIDEEFGVDYHPGHVRKMLKSMGFSVQRPRKRLSLANPVLQNKWHRYTYPNLKKNRGKKMR